MDSSIYGKIIDAIYGREYLIHSIPLILGRLSSSDVKCNLNERNSFIGKTIDFKQNSKLNNEINEISTLNIQSKLILNCCKRISPIHLILFYDSKENEFKFKINGNCYINSIQYPNPENLNNIVSIKSYDFIAFDCDICQCDHVYILLLHSGIDKSLINYEDKNLLYIPNITNNKINTNNNNNNTNNNNSNLNNNSKENILSNELNFPKYPPNKNLCNKWTTIEKDCLKKYILLFGYGRWEEIKNNSGGVLNEKKYVEIKALSNSFIRCIIELLINEKEKENNKKFLLKLIEEKNNEPYILPNQDDWGTLIKQKASAWGKRIQFLFYICEIVKNFQTEMEKNKEIREKINKNKEILLNEEEEELKKQIKTNFDFWENLLNFLPNSLFCGQKPSTWWTKSHDIDLIRGIYMYGYANYNLIRRDPNLIFNKLDNNNCIQEFPNADLITRRLKRIVHSIMKAFPDLIKNVHETIENGNNLEIIKEQTGFNLNEKNKIVDFLINHGIPLQKDGKEDFNLLKKILIEKSILNENSGQNKKNENNNNNNNNNNKEKKELTSNLLEHLIQRFRTVALITTNLKKFNLNEIDINLKYQIELDNDGFKLSYEKSNEFLNNLNYMEFIRKNFILNNFNYFNKCLEKIIKFTKEGQSEPNECKNNFWDCNLHDKNLLILVEENGFNYLNEQIQKNNIFINIPFTKKEYMKRIDFLCRIIHDYIKNPSQKTIFPSQKNFNYNNINTTIINSTLQIINFGRIEYERTNYHTNDMLFPIGYKSIRIDQSIYEIDKKVEYICEILDGGDKPQFKLVSEEEPDNPVVKESPTACWQVFYKKINSLLNNKKNKINVNGDEKFGLCDNQVIQYLQQLPNVEKCINYKIKEFN